MATWLLLSIFSALFLGLYDVAKKRSVDANAVLPVLFACSLASGALLPIEQVQVGDQVVAPASLESPREYAPYEVLETPRRTVAEVLDVLLEHEDGRRELLTATDEHPFAVEREAGLEWVVARELRAGDRVVADEGAATVQSVARRVAPTEVFNLVVESAHAYLVGDGVLVHNGNGCPPGADGGAKIGSAGGPGAGKRFAETTRDAAEAEAGGKCVFCGRETTRTAGGTQRNTDHSIPKSRGGNNTLDNAQNTCRDCNLKKAAQTTQEFQERIRQGGSSDD